MNERQQALLTQLIAGQYPGHLGKPKPVDLLCLWLDKLGEIQGSKIDLHGCRRVFFYWADDPDKRLRESVSDLDLIWRAYLAVIATPTEDTHGADSTTS